MGTEATPSPLSALGDALHLPSLIQPPPQGTGTGTANWDPQLGTERFGRTRTAIRIIANPDFGKTKQGGKFIRTGSLNKPPEVLLTALSNLEAKHKMENHRMAKYLLEMTGKYPKMATEFTCPGIQYDSLYKAEYDHPEDHTTCSQCDASKLLNRESRTSEDIAIHYGLIASGDQVMRHGGTRDRLRQELDILCFEMEAAGLIDSFPCLVIRGICDYADSHKNKQWQPYAAATASAYAKELLSVIPGMLVIGTQTAAEVTRVVALDGSRSQELNEKEGAQECLTALFLTNPRDDRENLIQIKGSRVDGTCEWIKSNKLYNSWLHSRSQLLWLSGGPGKGKTMLSVFLAEELEQRAKNSQDALFVQYFCDNRDEKKNTAVAILRGLVFQLLRERSKLFDYILPDFKIQRESLFTSSPFEALWRIFETMICDPILGTVYCVLDGLDECEEASLEVLLKKFKALFSTKFNDSSTCHLKLIAASRDLPEFIPEMLSTFPRVRLDPDADAEVNSDIRRFIEIKVNELSKYRQYPGPLHAHVKKVFLNRAKGTFLWVGIVANELRKYKATEVESALDLFPSGLEELYARMLLQIQVDRRETAAKILRWVTMAVRPLTLSELSAATETTVRPTIGFSCDEAIRDQVTFCGYFLTIVEDKIGLIHQSAKDYLLRQTPDSNPNLEFFRIKEEAGHLEIARKCLDYLESGALAGGKVNPKVDFYGVDTSHSTALPLFSYAALHWSEHARSLANSEDIFDLSRPFYSESLVREYWLKTYWAAKEYGVLPDSFSLLHLASYFGIVPLVENLLFKRKGWIHSLKRYIHGDQRDGARLTPLHWAAMKGHEAVARVLLEHRAGVDAKDVDGWTALHRAAMNGHEAVVQVLLEHRADVDVKDGGGWTALHRAAMKGHEAVARVLLEHRAGVDAKDGDGCTALHWAALKRHEAVARVLLEHRADVDAKDGDGRTALHRAARYGHEAMVRVLLEHRADVEAKDRIGGWTALHRAARYGHEAVAQVLLEHRADVDAKDGDGRTALHRAARYGHEAMVRVLLEHRADVDAKDGDGRTVLDYTGRPATGTRRWRRY